MYGTRNQVVLPLNLETKIKVMHSDYMIEHANFSVKKNDSKKAVFFANSNSEAEYLKILESDLLIIDDLGTETMSNIKFTELFNIINTRLLKDKKTIISTNLDLNELASFYDERVISRIIGNYIICRFFGDDVRLKAKKTSKY